ncbi:MFS transporter [Geodermatophilus sp. DF01_2]|uniref:MFS transporter n=1 Tax=Geodermatophilus sp. DF01-2 TaxID=2559610 RepID=UPI00142FFB41|nr:MFS transporter [Geodermatophilus sp. DF01_2]
MSAAGLSPGQARRRFVGLTALRWLPLGISVPVTVLLASARGLSPADIGVVLAVYSTVTLLLELPTGGLADAIGHRPVLVLSGLLTTAGLLTMAVAEGMAVFGLAWGLLGAGRALDSGPLEAWYVDAVHAGDPAADVTPGLSRAAAADGLGLALGAVLGGLIPLLAESSGGAALALPLLLAAALTGASVLAVALLVVPLRPPSESGVAALAAGVREVPRVIRDTGRLLHRDRLLRLLLLISFATGVALTSLELLGPLHVADLVGSPAGGAAVFGVVMAVSFGAAGTGSLLAPAARRSAGGSVARASAVSSVVAALTVAAVALSAEVALVAAAFVLFYLFNAVGWPLRQQLLHERTTSSQRSTTVSAKSLALMLGGLLGNLLLPRLAEAAGTPAGLLAGAAAMLLVAVLSVGLRPGTPGASRVAALHG